MRDHDDIATLLRSRLIELQARSEAIERDLQHPLEQDSAEQAIDLEDDEALSAVDAMLGEEIAAIQRALLRLETDDYGLCAGCGAEIGAARLEAQPAAALCIECAQSNASS
ncbi:hypothetical protein ASE00_14370 [Sphingomonas sp. Root710]|uniref:TraR/DksA family transcriptional regulator n=1 Tax=Sphingomonas sp. Root710 TaxID=1736594 RepID=UPI0006F45E91|nr:TraR/DksA family transcriptional regulator [Sphingomonas sp. Root710]KRB81189.1 hypothetical protein ASE00_14370 [Sphingomonas sp. Root710]